MEKVADVRISNWSADDLSKKQIEYAAKDGYATIMVYNALMACVVPKLVPRLTKDEMKKDGVAVTLFNHSWKGQAAAGTLSVHSWNLRVRGPAPKAEAACPWLLKFSATTEWTRDRIFAPFQPQNGDCCSRIGQKV